ncbi:MAG: acyl-[acyl-carrier-protein]--UDP-N-acetylglucosamine O-acyltransferase, partial [Candidatus Cloacimonetes bacterium]|nr:acyl-[acyl-carrier-protein]--UDP-N-acetylglucosamine O-acyltransferase [Candidatus Cloacimonadota bacterium]
GLNTSQALAEVETWSDLTPEQKVFVEFIRKCERGLSR